jgi:hypothetical protein
MQRLMDFIPNCGPKREVGPTKAFCKSIPKGIAFGTDAGVYPMASMLKNLAW